MSNMLEEITRLESISLPTWESIPKEGIYKEGLLSYLREILLPLNVVDENIITSSIINNYVKLGYIDKPIKKKYFRPAIAQLIVISIFKQVILIEDLVMGIDFEISNYGLEEGYENFKSIFNQAREATLTASHVDSFDLSISFNSHHDKVLTYLAISLFTKLYTKIAIDKRKEL